MAGPLPCSSIIEVHSAQQLHRGERSSRPLAAAGAAARRFGSAGIPCRRHLWHPGLPCSRCAPPNTMAAAAGPRRHGSSIARRAAASSSSTCLRAGRAAHLRAAAAAGIDASLPAATASATPGPAAVDIAIEPGPNNSRCIWAGIDVAAPAEAVYAALTAYEQLGTFIPGLADNRCLERYADGCRLLQIGKQELALGLKFRARVVLRIREHPAGVPPRLLCRGPNSPRQAPGRSGASSGRSSGGSSTSEGRWPMPRGMGPWADSLSSGWGSGSSSGSSSEEEGGWSEWRYLRPRSPLAAPAADISFELVEGDFAAFKGLWRTQPAGDAACRLSYSLFVRPQPWLLVGLIENRIQGEICANLAAVKAHVERQSGGQGG